MFSSDVPGVRMVRSEKKTVRSEKRSTRRYPAQAKSSFIQNSKTKKLIRKLFSSKFPNLHIFMIQKVPKKSPCFSTLSNI